METIELIILPEYVDHSISERDDFLDVINCPLAKSVKKTLNIDYANVDIDRIDGRINGELYTIAKIKPGFYWEDYRKLRNGEISEFKTILTKY